MPLTVEIALVLLLLALSGFFSASETSLFSLRPWRVERLRREDPGAGEAVSRLLGDPLRLLVTVVVGAEVVTVAASNLTAIMRREWFSFLGSYGIALAAGSTSVIFLLFGEITPKTLAANYPEWVSARVARPLSFFARLLAPLVAPLAVLASRIRSRRRGEGAPALTEANFRMLIEMGASEGVLDRREMDMIGSVFRLGELPVRAVMVPRTDIVALPATATLSEALAHIREMRHSRVPLFEGNLDRISGILYAKDLIGLDDPRAGSRPALDFARPAHFVPEMTRAGKLIQEFQARRLHLAVVVDEYGGTSGLVSLEDLLEEIVGDIEDDYDRPIVLHRSVRKGLDWARGSLPFVDFKRKFRARARAGDYDTLAGYVLKLFGRVPVEGERVSDGQYAYTILRVSRRRIIDLMIERQSPAEKKGPGVAPGPA